MKPKIFVAYRPQPGDVVFLETDRRASASEHARVQETWKHVVGVDAKVVLLDGGVRLVGMKPFPWWRRLISVFDKRPMSGVR